MQKLQRQNARLNEELRKAHIIIDVQKKVAALLGPSASGPRSGEGVLMAAVTELATAVGTRAACLALWVPRGSYYRDRRSRSPGSDRSAAKFVRALAAAERETILAYLHHQRFQDRSPAEVYATLLDEGQYHCSIRTMYRLLSSPGRIPRTPRPTDPSRLSQARLPDHGSQSTSELGHHQTFQVPRNGRTSTST